MTTKAIEKIAMQGTRIEHFQQIKFSIESFVFEFFFKNERN